ncbi:MAG: DUF6353 family protein [Clostridiales bacterium]|nr:DUF6353 family protein [Clostridiales bacterium]
MNKSVLSQMAKGMRTAVNRRSPEILTGIGIAGMITATIMTARATPKALILIENRKLESKADKLTPIETVKTAWTCYIPAAVTGCLSIACLIGASSVNIRRNAALATAYALSESAMKEYQEKIVETIGEKKERAVRDAVTRDKIDRDPVSNREVIITKKGNTLCYDVISGRYFKSDIDILKKAANELNRNMLDDMYISINDLYYEIGLSGTKQGDDLGWNIVDGFIDLQFSSHLADDGTPCLALDYRVAPRYDYQKR